MDHRCGTRFTLSVAVELQVKGQAPTAGRLVVISVTGALLEANRALAPLTPVLLRPLSANEFRRDIEAYVVRTTEKGVALEWVEAACDDVLMLLPGRPASVRISSIGPSVQPSSGSR